VYSCAPRARTHTQRQARLPEHCLTFVLLYLPLPTDLHDFTRYCVALLLYPGSTAHAKRDCPNTNKTCDLCGKVIFFKKNYF
jgi:hypothetical protein